MLLPSLTRFCFVASWQPDPGRSLVACCAAGPLVAADANASRSQPALPCLYTLGHCLHVNLKTLKPQYPACMPVFCVQRTVLRYTPLGLVKEVYCFEEYCVNFGVDFEEIKVRILSCKPQRHPTRSLHTPHQSSFRLASGPPIPLLTPPTPHQAPLSSSDAHKAHKL